MGNDRYSNFKELERDQKLDKDFKLSLRDVSSRVTIIAPHGGKIEPRTSDLARLIAGDNYNFYCFEGIKDKDNACLHITSHRFDEPGAVKLISKSRVVVAVHACTGEAGLVHIGGLNKKLGNMIANELRNRAINVSDEHPRFQGSNPDNICNRGATGIGVQLEVTRDLRDDPQKIKLIALAVRAALLNFGEAN
ncbi:MAG: poly-gamma-glutamate hydrolase family protein [Desulfobacterales bacterium]